MTKRVLSMTMAWLASIVYAVDAVSCRMCQPHQMDSCTISGHWREARRASPQQIRKNQCDWPMAAPISSRVRRFHASYSILHIVGNIQYIYSEYCVNKGDRSEWLHVDCSLVLRVPRFVTLVGYIFFLFSTCQFHLELCKVIMQAGIVSYN